MEGFISGSARCLAGAQWHGTVSLHLTIYESKLPRILFFSRQWKKKSAFPTNVKLLAHFIGQRQSLIAPYCVFSELFLGCEDCAIKSTGDFHMYPPFHHLPHLKETLSRSQPQIIIMSFSQQDERLQMGQKPPTQLVSGLLLKAEKAGAISPRMTKEHNSIQQTEGEKKKKKLCCGIFIYSWLWQKCPWRALAGLHHKPESLWWEEKALSVNQTLEPQPLV